jgi:riboflavin kinase/FMN adenylyltransferase
MKIIRDLESYSTDVPVALTQGTFDGVHLGHQKIINQLKEAAKKINGKSVLLTFYPHPRLVLYPEFNQLKLIHTLDEKIEILSRTGLDELVLVPFTKAFSRQTAKQFVRDVLVNKLNVKSLVVGYDHRFGKNREGSKDELVRLSAEMGFEIEEISAQNLNEVTVSSTKIRKALEEGDISTANLYLGRPFCISGEVMEGRKLGRTIGFPTANIELGSEHKLVPKNGVYAVYITVPGNPAPYKGMLNIGDIPSIPDKDWTIEVHIFDFDREIYGDRIHIDFIKRMRSEKKFENLEALAAQLSKDKTVAQEVLKKNVG